MSQKHTPGPWTFDNHSPAVPLLGVYAPDNKSPWHADRSDDEKAANARLIAAAPDLLFELEGLVHFADGFGVQRTGPIADELRKWINGARAAIAKAAAGEMG